MPASSPTSPSSIPPAVGLAIAATVVGLLAVPSAPPADAAAPSLRAGLYAGTVTDADGDPETYRASIRITARTLRVKRRAGNVSYVAPEDEQTGAFGLQCKGTLTYRGRSGNRFRFTETIAGGADAQCVSGGTVVLTRTSTRRLTYTWSLVGQTRTAPSGALTRR